MIHHTPAELFRSGYDTAEIAHRLNLPEAQIYNGRGYVSKPTPVWAVLPPARGPVYLGWFPKVLA